MLISERFCCPSRSYPIVFFFERRSKVLFFFGSVFVRFIVFSLRNKNITLNEYLSVKFCFFTNHKTYVLVSLSLSPCPFRCLCRSNNGPNCFQVCCLFFIFGFFSHRKWHTIERENMNTKGKLNRLIIIQILLELVNLER